MIGNMKKYSLVLILFLALLMQPGCKNKDTGTVSNEKEKKTDGDHKGGERTDLFSNLEQWSGAGGGTVPADRVADPERQQS